MSRLVYISGRLGAGKSSLAFPLAAELGYSLVTKDLVKETLHDALFVSGEDELGQAWSRRLGGASMELLWVLAACAGDMVIEANFHPQSEYERGKLRGLGGRVVEVHCACPAEVAVARYNARQRHEVHWLTTATLATMGRYDRPVGIGPLITVDTTVPVDVASVAAEVRRLHGGAFLPVPAPKCSEREPLLWVPSALRCIWRSGWRSVRSGSRAAARRGEGFRARKGRFTAGLNPVVDASGVTMTSINERPMARQVVDSVVRQARLDQLSTRGPEAAREKDRTVLLTQPTVPTRVDYARQRLDRAVLDSFMVLVPLQVLPLPMMIEGVDEPPGTADAEGDISTFLLSPGGVDFQADLVQDPGKDPGGLPADRWWTHTWVDTAAFPAAPESGRLYFQFTVDVDFRCITPGAVVRGVYAFVTLQSEAFLQISYPIQVPQFTALGQSTSSNLTGSIPVAAGQQLDLDLTYGMTLFAGNGEFASQGSFATHRTVPEPSTADFGIIEYRFIPDWWITSVSQVTGLVNK